MGTNHTNKKSFLMYKDWYELIKELSNEDAGKFIKAIYDYIHGVEVGLSGDLKYAFIPIKTQFIRDLEKWQEKSKKATEAINKRWNTNVYESKKRNTDDTVIVKDKVDVNVKVDDNVISYVNKWVQKINSKTDLVNEVNERMSELENPVSFYSDKTQGVNFIPTKDYETNIEGVRKRIDNAFESFRKNKTITNREKVTYIDNEGNRRDGRTHEIIKEEEL